MAKPRNTIYIQPEAPAKPEWGSACNGCGVCCLAEPCPVGIVLSGRRTGPCRALVWAENAGAYRCGAMSEPQQMLTNTLPRWMQFATMPLAALLRWLAPRWISVGSGCDSTLEVATPSGRIHFNRNKSTESPDP